MRLFTAILLPAEVRSHLDELGDRLAPFVQAEIAAGSKGQMKWVAAEALHVTLKFLGEIEDANVPVLVDRLRQSTNARSTTFTLRAGHLVCLPPGRRAPVRIIAASLDGYVERLQRTYAAIEAASQKFGVPAEGRPFFPHITLARCRRPLPPFMRDDFAKASSPGPWFEVSEFALVQSALKPDGPEYRTIATFPAA